MRRDAMRWADSCVLVCVVSAMGAGCGDTAATPTEASGAAAIGAAGGAVVLRDGIAAGATVAIPAGALATTVTITLRAGEATEIPTLMEAVGPAVVYGPEGQTFATPVTVTVPTTSEATALYTRPLVGGEWTPVPGATWDAARHTISGSVQHFSMFVPLRMGRDAGAPSCASGTADCDRDSRNGCEARVDRDARNCGACGNTCVTGATCTAGVCGSAPAVDAGTPPADAGPPSCAPGTADCDHDSRNGCEARVDRDASNCGACGVVCPSGRVCTAGACVAASVDAGTPSCPSGMGDCDLLAANGCEVNLASDARNCGACGAVCPSGQVCTAGLCH